MNYTITSIMIGSLIAVAVGWSVYQAKQQEDMVFDRPTADTSMENINDQSNVPDQTTGNANADSESTSGLTTDIVANHNTADSCWSIINDNVYDLTSWIPQHPGGPQAIMQLCGVDGSSKFNGQHGGGQRQLDILAGFRIGKLTQ